MYLIIVMAVYFTIRDVQLIRGALRNMKSKRKLPEFQQPTEPDKGEDNKTDEV